MNFAGRIRARKTDRGQLDAPGSHRTDQDPAGRSRAPREEAGHRGTKQGTAGRSRALRDGSGPRRTNQAPAAERIRPPRKDSGPEEETRAPVDDTDTGPRKTNQGAAGRIRSSHDKSVTSWTQMAPQDGSEPLGTSQAPRRPIRAPQDESGPHGTNHGLQDESGAQSRTFFCK